MALLAFPIICVYFLIGAFLGKVFTTNTFDDDVENLVWFAFWPVVIAANIFMVVFFLLVRVVKVLAKILSKFHRYMTTY